ncbi:hypothetical protein WR25_04516 isoform B [Diploscapter pachys]|nr:hypothetical protein WR25_04516 isoform B [Diploscapter pachys]
MRESMAKVLLDKELYRALNERTVEVDFRGARVDTSLDWRTKEKFDSDRQSTISARLREHFPELTKNPIKCESLLDEMVFWIIRQTFPQNLINFSLSMLSETEYRVENALACRFFEWYPLVANCVRELCQYQATHGRQNDVVQNTCSRVIHVSVQMLSSEALCRKLNEECDLVNVVLASTYFLFSENLAKTMLTLDPIFKYCASEDDLQNLTRTWEVMVLEQNCVISSHGYWFIMGDMQNLLSHYSLSVATILHPTAFSNTYVNIIKKMQENIFYRNWRIRFSGMHQIWRIDWLLAISPTNSFPIRSTQEFTVTFHIPLHRHISTALSHLYAIPDFKQHVDKFCGDEALLRKIMLHPLRIQVARAEYNAGMWVRNGNQLRIQTIIYAQSHLNMAFQTPDIDLIRFCAANINSNYFIDCIVDSFHMLDFIQIPMDEDSDTRVVDGEIRDAEVAVDACEQMRKLLQAIPKELKPATRAMLAIRQIQAQNSSNQQQETEAEVPMEVDKTPKEDERKEELQEDMDARIRAKAEMAPLIGFEWLGENRARVITRLEWIDNMVSAAFLLIAELVSVRLNCGATHEEAIRSEMINSLSMEDMVHSRLRGCIAEKGSRGSEAVDKIFDKILGEIADFIEPDANPNGQMRQGVYQLKPEMWQSEFCPVFCQMRALSPKFSSTVLMDVEKKDREAMKKMNPNWSTHSNATLWIPYRLEQFQFNGQRRHQAVEHIAKILLCDRFVQLALITLKTAAIQPYVRDTTVQLVVYLLSLGARYASAFPEDKCREMLKAYHCNYKFSDMQTPTTVFTMMNVMLRREINNDPAIGETVLKKIVSGELDKNRIVGTGVDYIGRFFAIIYKSDISCQLFLKDSLMDYEKKATIPAEPSSDKGGVVTKRKLEAQKLRESLLAAQKKKNVKVMQKMMDSEGITQEEMDKIDTKQPDVKLYECPICGDIDVPSTLKRPLGMLVKVTSNWLHENQLSRDQPERSLMEVDELCQQDESNRAKLVEPKRKWIPAKAHLHGNVFISPLNLETHTAIELKTCGHTAHLDCFNAYKSTLHPELRMTYDNGRDMMCPLCRFSVNGLLPITIDLGYETQNRGPYEEPMKIYSAIADSIRCHAKNFISSEDKAAYINHYTFHMKGVLSKVDRNERDKEENAAKVASQSIVVAVIAAHLDRLLLYKDLDVVERRKNSRNLIVEHLIPAVVARTNRKDEQICLTLLSQLLLHNFRTSLVATNSQEGLLTVSDDDLINETDIGRDDLRALQSTRRHSLGGLSSGPSSPLSPEYADIPVLLNDPKFLFVRLSSFIIDNRNLSKEDKKELCYYLAKAIFQMAAVKSALMAVLRVTKREFQQLINTDMQQMEDPMHTILLRLMKKVSFCLNSSESVYKCIMNQAPVEEKFSIPNLLRNVELNLFDFVKYISEFWQHTFIPCEKMSQDGLKNKKLEPVLQLIGLDSKKLAASKDFVNAWVGKVHTIITQSMRIPAKPLSSEPITWRPFVLLDLPDKYDRLFARYFQRPCKNCNKPPPNPMVCLLCGELCCLDDCCRVHASPQRNEEAQEQTPPIVEVERHASECGNGACVFISLNSSLIVIVRYKLAAIWGSVYLDAHGEEDRNLRRGKPLFLSERRMKCLYSDWAEQEWIRAGNWLPLITLVNALKESHFAYR